MRRDRSIAELDLPVAERSAALIACRPFRIRFACVLKWLLVLRDCRRSRLLLGAFSRVLRASQIAVEALEHEFVSLARYQALALVLPVVRRAVLDHRPVVDLEAALEDDLFARPRLVLLLLEDNLAV